MRIALAFLAVLAVAAPAAAGEIIVGAGVGFGSEIEMPGLQIGGYYALDGKLSRLRVGGDVDGFLPNSDRGVSGDAKVTWFDIDANAQYMLPVLPEDSPLSFYAMAGLNFAIVHASFTYDPGVNQRDISNSDVKPGLNLGGGGEYDIGFAAVYGELKYVISDADQFVAFAGLRFALPSGS